MEDRVRCRNRINISIIIPRIKSTTLMRKPRIQGKNRDEMQLNGKKG